MANHFVVPAYNEAGNVGRLLGDLEARPALWAGGRVIVVDDGSADGTAEVAEAHRGALPLEVLRQPRNMGAGRAFDTGFRRALELAGPDELVVTLEADTTSDLDRLERMLAEAQRADVVLASVHAGGDMIGVSRTRRGLSRGAAVFMRRATGVDARTVSSFFRVYRASILRRGYEVYGENLIREAGFACKAEILTKLVKHGARISEVTVNLDQGSRVGESKMRVLPTVAGYVRMLARHATDRRAA